MTAFAYERIKGNLPVNGIFEVPKNLSVGEAIEQLSLIAECSLKDKWKNQVRFLPLR